MLGRKRSGAVICPSCGRLVGVNDAKCLNCGRRNPGLWGFTPLLRLGHDFGFAPLVIAACIVLYLASLLIDPASVGRSGLLTLFSPGQKSLFLLGASGSFPVFYLGRWWTVLSAGWLHAGALHILFNMLWVRQLAPEAAEAYGAARMVIIYTVAGVTGFITSSFVGHYLFFLPSFLHGAGFTVGASASIFGLLGALVHYGHRRGPSMIGRQALSYAVLIFLFGFVMPGVDNWAHLGGFAGGWATSRWLDPWREERVDHVIGAFVCLIASAAAIIASILTAIPLVR